MEFLVATAIGAMTAAGTYLVLRGHSFPVIVGFTLLSYAVNLFLFAMGRLVVNAPPVIVDGVSVHTDPLPQALVLTAIVISFGMTALIVVLALRGYLESGNDRVDALIPADPLEVQEGEGAAGYRAAPAGAVPEGGRS